jgi:hypothetical protein
MCHLTNIFCSTCNITTPCVLDVNVKGRIVFNEGDLSHLDVIVKFFWIQPLIGLDEAKNLSMHSKKFNCCPFVEGHLNSWFIFLHLKVKAW